MKKEGSLFSSACDAMDRSGRELPGEIGTTHFLILGRKEGGEEIKRLSNVSPLAGFAREKLKKGKRQVKKTGCDPKLNKVDSIDDKIRLVSKSVEVLTTVRSPSKILRLPAWRPIHWI